MFKSILKIIGIVLLSFAGGIGVVVGGMAIAGQFKKETVALNGIAFEQSSYYIDSTTEIMVISTPENSTVSSYTLSLVSGENVINIPNGCTANVGFSVSPKQLNGANVGGYAKLRAVSSDNHFCECSIYVDVPVTNISVVTEAESEIIVGNKINLNLNYLPAKSKLPYTNAEQKTIKYSSTNTAVATVNETTGEVTTISTGIFQIKATCFKSLLAEKKYLVLKEAGTFDIGEFEDETKLDEEEYLEGVTVSNISNTFTVRKSRVASVEVTQPDVASIQDIYLYEKITLTPTDLGLKINPEANSNLTWQDNAGLAKDLTVVAVNDTSSTSNTDISGTISVTKKYEGTAFLGWEIQALKYEDRILNNTRIQFSFTNDNDATVTTSYPINIVKNVIKAGENTFTLSSGIENDKYNKNVKFYEYYTTDAEPSIDTSKSIYENYQLQASLQVVDDSKPDNVAIRYFITDLTKTGVINTCAGSNGTGANFVQQGEIISTNGTRGYVQIIGAGDVSVVAYAVEVDINGNPIIVNNAYKIVATANNEIALNIQVTEMLTNVALEITDESVITTEESGVTYYREGQDNIEVTVTTNNDLNVLIAWLEQGYVQFSSKNENYAVISYDILESNGEQSPIDAVLKIHMLNTVTFTSEDKTNKKQKNVNAILTLNLTESGKTYFKTNPSVVENGEAIFDYGKLSINIQTARVTDFEASTNAKTGSENKIIFSSDAWTTNGSDVIDLKLTITPENAYEKGFTISSSNTSILSINNNADITSSQDDEGITTYDYSACLNWNVASPSFDDGDTVTITITSKDDTFYTDPSYQARGVYQTLTFTLYHS